MKKLSLFLIVLFWTCSLNAAVNPVVRGDGTRTAKSFFDGLDANFNDISAQLQKVPSCTNSSDVLVWDTALSKFKCSTPIEITAGSNINIENGVISSTAAGFYTQSIPPTISSLSGGYINSTDASIWYKTEDWLCKIGVSCLPIYELTVTPPTNGSVSSLKLNIDCPDLNCTANVLSGDTVNDWVFSNNQGYSCENVIGFDSGDCNGASILIDSNSSVSAQFVSSSNYIADTTFPGVSIPDGWIKYGGGTINNGYSVNTPSSNMQYTGLGSLSELYFAIDFTTPPSISTGSDCTIFSTSDIRVTVRSSKALRFYHGSEVVTTGSVVESKRYRMWGHVKLSQDGSPSGLFHVKLNSLDGDYETATQLTTWSGGTCATPMSKATAGYLAAFTLNPTEPIIYHRVILSNTEIGDM